MRKCAELGCATILALLCASAAGHAQIFISGTGNDANPCSRAAPCRTLQRGIDATGAGREMTILNTGEYGPGNIAKSITISADGVNATVRSFAAGSTAITINNANVTVVLRNLFITGGDTGARGIFIDAARAVHIIDTEVERFTGSGITLFTSDAELYVSDSTSRDNGAHGLVASGTGSNATLTVDRSNFENNGGNGIYVQHIEALVTHSVSSGNASDGIELSGAGRMTVAFTSVAHNALSGYLVTKSTSRMALESSVARGNVGAGLRVDEGATALISNTALTHNGTGLLNNGQTFSTGTNFVSGNAGNVAGSNPDTAPPI